jgi:hypothetical protein
MSPGPEARPLRLGSAEIHLGPRLVEANARSMIELSCFVTDPEGNRFALHQRTV